MKRKNGKIQLSLILCAVMLIAAVVYSPDDRGIQSKDLSVMSVRKRKILIFIQGIEPFIKIYLNV